MLTSQELASSNGVNIERLRISGRQAHCANQDTGSNVEAYYRVSVFIPFLDTFISSLRERFLNYRELFNGFISFLSRKLEDFGIIDHEFNKL